MRLLTKFALAAAVLANHALAVPLIATPGDAADIIINADDTVNATASASSTTSEVAAVPVHILAAAATTTAGQLSIALKNNLASSNVHAYVTGLDVNGALVMLQPNGEWYYPTATSSGVPVEITGNVAIPVGAEGTTTTITLPGYISAGRVWFADGTLEFFTVEAATGDASLVEPSAVNPSDPSADTNWGFIELTNDENEGLYVNLSFVDFTGLPLGITLTDTSGNTYEALGLASDAVTNICSELASQSASDKQDWVDLCVYSTSGTALRALSPYNYLAGINSSAFENYWTAYIDKVWTYYETHTLTIDTQAAAGKVACTVSASTGNLTCAGDNRGYTQPSAGDIFGCNAGPFAILGGDNAVHYAVVPRLCAAFHRSTFLLSGGNVQPSLPASDYYTVNPTNWYSAIVHDWQIDGKGYTFPYDDVTPTGDVNESGLLATTEPDLLTVIIGGAC